MNESIVYRRCRKIRETMGVDGYTAEIRVQWSDIEPYVAMQCGADPRTLDKYRHYLTYFGFFKEYRAGFFQLCERDKFGNAITVQKDLTMRSTLLARTAKHRTPKRNY